MIVKSVVDYSLQLEVLAESDKFAMEDADAMYNFTSTHVEYNDPTLNSTTGYMTAEED